jgi:hypothetical protein
LAEGIDRLHRRGGREHLLGADELEEGLRAAKLRGARGYALIKRAENGERCDQNVFSGSFGRLSGFCRSDQRMTKSAESAVQRCASG